MTTKHQFVVSSSGAAGTGQAYTLSDTTVLSIYGVLSLKSRHPELSTNVNVLAIKSLRSMTGMGLYEAKQIVDFLAANAVLNENNGTVSVEVPRQSVTYTPLA